MDQHSVFHRHRPPSATLPEQRQKSIGGKVRHIVLINSHVTSFRYYKIGIKITAARRSPNVLKQVVRLKLFVDWVLNRCAIHYLLNVIQKHHCCAEPLQWNILFSSLCFILLSKHSISFSIRTREEYDVVSKPKIREESSIQTMPFLSHSSDLSTTAMRSTASLTRSYTPWDFSLNGNAKEHWHSCHLGSTVAVG